MHPNLHNPSDVGSMLGPSVQAHSGSDDQVSVEVGNQFGKTALTDEEWAKLAAGKRGFFQVVVTVDYANGPHSAVSKPGGFVWAHQHMRGLMSNAWAAPHAGRRVRVLAQSEVARLGLGR